MTATILYGKPIATPIRSNVRARVQALREAGWVPRLASVQIGDNEAAALYKRNQRRVCDELGIEFEDREYPQDTSHDEMLAAVRAMNVNPRITGIILQRPVPPHIQLDELEAAIHPTKDVEGMNPANIGRVVYGDFVIGPCTSIASVEMLRATGLQLRGLEVVIVGHSEIVGKPIALHLLKELATVTVCHHATRDLAYHTCRADALFVAVGKPALITGDMVKPGAAVIDIGINIIEIEGDEGERRNKTVGDVDFESVSEVAGWLTPVPRGVGPVTLSILMRNTVAGVEMQRRNYEKAILS